MVHIKKEIQKESSLWCKIVLTVVAVAFLCTISIPNRFTEPKRVIGWDIKNYYAYLPAYFIDHNIEMIGWTNEGIPAFDQKYWLRWVRDDMFIIKTTMGVAFFYAPFFAAAHLLAEPLGYPADGFSLPYAFSLLLSGAVFVWIGLLVLSRFLRRHFSDKVTAAVIAILGLTTNLFWYATFEAPMSHGYNFFLFASFLLLTELWYEEPTWGRTLLIGLVFGCISLIRPTNSLIVIVFLLYRVEKWADIPEHFKTYLQQWPKILSIIALTLLVWLPQCLYWKHITGHFFFYSYFDEGFYWSDPKFFQVLFGFRKGLFIYSPVLLAALPGYFLLWKRQRDYFWPIIIFSILNVYIISSWWCWWYGGSFGLRAFIESFALLSIPLGLFITWVAAQKRWLRTVLFSLVFVLGLQSAFHFVQYYNEVIHYEGMNKKAYFHFFWKVKQPKDYWYYITLPDPSHTVRPNK